jgi:N-acetylglucosamine-6-sulfatase
MKKALAAGLGAAGMAAMPQSLAAQTSPAPRTDKRPNIVFFLIDDLAETAVGYAGRFPFLKTPNIDALAAGGAVFANAFVTTSLCSPARASFPTGAYVHHHGVRDNRGATDPQLTIFPQMLQQAGYETAFIGKWHMVRKDSPRPGFDYWLSFNGQGVYRDPPLNENGRRFKAEGYITDLLTDYAVRWLQQPRSKPFCMLLWHKAVHAPFAPADRHKDAFPDAEIPKPANAGDDLKDKPKWMSEPRASEAQKPASAPAGQAPLPETGKGGMPPRRGGRLGASRRASRGPGAPSSAAMRWRSNTSCAARGAS